MDLSRIKLTEQEIPHVAVGVCDTGHNTHTGVVYRDSGTMRFLEQAFHFDTKNRPVQESVQYFRGLFLFAVPDLEEDRARNVAGMCRLVAKWLVDKQLAGLPYALQLDEQTRFDPVTGELIMPSGIGLSCSTFVIVVFRSARIRFIDFVNWPLRPDDAVAHARLVRMLESWRDQGRASAEHVEKVRNQIGCVRARPEEIAGACLLDLPARFPFTEIAGKAILAALGELQHY